MADRGNTKLGVITLGDRGESTQLDTVRWGSMGCDEMCFEWMRVRLNSLHPRRGSLANAAVDPWQNASEHGSITYQRPWIKGRRQI